MISGTHKDKQCVQHELIFLNYFISYYTILTENGVIYLDQNFQQCHFKEKDLKNIIKTLPLTLEYHNILNKFFLDKITKNWPRLAALSYQQILDKATHIAVKTV